MQRVFTIKRLFSSFGMGIGHTVGKVQAHWSSVARIFNELDYPQQVTYFSLLYMTEIWKAQNILEVGCGTGKMIPMALNMKGKQASYLASDLSPSMIDFTKQNMRKHLQMLKNEPNYEQWLDSRKLSFRVANGEEKIQSFQKDKFDRIISNLVLNMTANPKKMLTNFYDISSEDCLLGISIPSHEQNGKFFQLIQETFNEVQFKYSAEESMFYVSQQLQSLLNESGWQIIVEWEQNVLLAPLSENKNFEKFLKTLLEDIPDETRGEAEEILLRKFQMILQERRGLNQIIKMVVAKKKSPVEMI